MKTINRLQAAFSTFREKKEFFTPGPTRIAKGDIPAGLAHRRVPLLVWGDVFPDGDRPQVRRVLAGADAHECMYSWVYQNELLTANDLVQVAAKQSYDEPKQVGAIRARFDALRAGITDPQYQISGDLIERFIPATVFLVAAGSENAEFCELGSTFFASIEKLDLCSRIVGSPLDRGKLQFSGIEYSPFLKRASLHAHPNDNIRLVTTPEEWARARPYAFHLSRFVGSYAFRSTQEMVDQIVRCDAFHVTDAFNLEPTDFHSWDLGLPITFMNLPALLDGLAGSGFDLYLTSIDPEFHAAGKQKAAVVRLFGIKREIGQRLGYFERFDRMGGFASVTGARLISRGDGPRLLKEVDAALTTEEWDAFAHYKKYFPIWGPPQGLTRKQVDALVSSKDLDADLLFDDGQAAAVVRRALAMNAWGPASSPTKD
jgi:hypothetical protein